MDKNELTTCTRCFGTVEPGYTHMYDTGEGTCKTYALGPTLTETQPELPGVESTLAERAKRYGDFAMAAKATQDIKAILFGTGWNTTIPADCRQAAEMIVTKLVRAMYGEPEFPDNWHDIAGYATLVERRLRG